MDRIFKEVSKEKRGERSRKIQSTSTIYLKEKKNLVFNSEELLVRIKEKGRKSFTIVNSFLFYSEPQYRDEVLCYN